MIKILFVCHGDRQTHSRRLDIIDIFHLPRIFRKIVAKTKQLQ